MVTLQSLRSTLQESDSAGADLMDGANPIFTKERLLESAPRLFCQEGIQATGIARLLSDAEVAV